MWGVIIFHAVATLLVSVSTLAFSKVEHAQVRSRKSVLLAFLFIHTCSVVFAAMAVDMKPCSGSRVRRSAGPAAL